MYVTVVSAALIMGAILFVIEGVMPVLLLIALVFLFYVQSTVEPEDMEYKITTEGIHVGGKKTYWENMARFWFTHRFGSDLLVLETFTVPGRMELVIDTAKKSKMVEELEKYLLHEEAPATFFDRAASWASRQMPDYNQHAASSRPEPPRDETPNSQP